MAFIFYVFFLITVIRQGNANPIPLRTYTLEKNSLGGVKPADISVFDVSKKTLYYRIEFQFGLMPKIDFVTYPSKRITAKLEKKTSSTTNLQFLDDQTSKWLHGKMTQHFKLLGRVHTIDFNGRQIYMETEGLSSRTIFRDKSKSGTLLAQIQRDPSFKQKTIRLEIYSNDLPDSLYLLTGIRTNYKKL